MAGLFIRSYPSIVINSSGNNPVISPVINMLNNQPDLVWRSNGLASLFVVFDLGSALSVDCLALLFNNLRSIDTVRWRGAASVAALTTTPVYDSSQVAWTGNKAEHRKAKSVTLPTTVSLRYWRFDITATAHPDTYVEIGRLVIGKSIFPTELDTSLGRMGEDRSIINSGPGFDDTYDYGTLPGWKVSYSFISDDIWNDTWFPFIETIGLKVPVLFIPEPELPTRLQNSAVFGRIKDRIEGEHPFHNGWSQQFTIVGIAP